MPKQQYQTQYAVAVGRENKKKVVVLSLLHCRLSMRGVQAALDGEDLVLRDNGGLTERLTNIPGDLASHVRSRGLVHLAALDTPLDQGAVLESFAALNPQVLCTF